VHGADVLVYSTSLPVNGNVGPLDRYRETRDVKYLMDFPASRLQAEFGLMDAMVVGVNQLACASLIAGIRLATMILNSESDRTRALCVTSDRFPEGALYEQAYNLISDGAAACLVTREPNELRILGGHGITNGAMAFASDDQTIGNYFTYTHRLITELLARHALTITDVSFIVPQNINVVTSQVLSSLLGFDPERVLFPTMPEVGHMISGDNIVNLGHLLRESRFRPGDKILLPMAGYGLNWQCLLLEKV
jgi:3-oxoacyl-[acyl-carrier-protein] synthase-3